MMVPSPPPDPAPNGARPDIYDELDRLVGRCDAHQGRLDIQGEVLDDTRRRALATERSHGITVGAVSELQSRYDNCFRALDEARSRGLNVDDLWRVLLQFYEQARQYEGDPNMRPPAVQAAIRAQLDVVIPKINRVLQHVGIVLVDHGMRIDGLEGVVYGQHGPAIAQLRDDVTAVQGTANQALALARANASNGDTHRIAAAAALATALVVGVVAALVGVHGWPLAVWILGAGGAAALIVDLLNVGSSQGQANANANAAAATTPAQPQAPAPAAPLPPTQVLPPVGSPPAGPRAAATAAAGSWN